MDYLSYWSLDTQPFVRDDDSVFFAGAAQREAIAGLNYFVTRQLNSAFLVAPGQCGMTRLLRHVQRMRGLGDCAVELVVTDGTHLGCDAVRRELCEALGYQRLLGDGSAQLDRAIAASNVQGVQMVWCIDGCKQAATRVARDLALNHSNLAVVIGTTPEEFEGHVARFGRCGMRIDLTPLTVEDTIHYVRFCLQHAGCTRQVFSDSSAVRLHELTGGALAALAVAAESALALAARHRIDEITPAFVEAVREQIAQAA